MPVLLVPYHYWGALISVRCLHYEIRCNWLFWWFPCSRGMVGCDHLIVQAPFRVLFIVAVFIIADDVRIDCERLVEVLVVIYVRRCAKCSILVVPRGQIERCYVVLVS